MLFGFMAIYVNTVLSHTVSEYIPIPACRLFIWQGNNSMIDCLGRSGGKTHTSKAPLCTQSNGRLLGQHFALQKAGSPVQPGFKRHLPCYLACFELGIHVI